MPPVLTDSNIIIAARFSRDQNHNRANEITAAFDHGDLPIGHIPSDALEEILNYVNERGSHEAAVATLDKLQESSGFEIVYTQKSDFDAGRSLFRQYEGLSLTDGVLAAYMQRVGIEHLYSFDDDFDTVGGITRLDTAVNPFS
jgi:hypothetical protein